MMFNATFSQAAFAQKDALHAGLGIVTAAFNIYFVWVFGSLVEIRLGYLRYMAVLVAGILAGWFCLGMEAGTGSAVYFVGPAFLTAAILGAYLNFLPEKKIQPGGNIGRSYKVIVTEPVADASKAFNVSPWTLFGLFFVWQVALHFLFSWLGAAQFDNGRILSLIAALVAGLVVSVVLIMLATPSVEGHPLQRLAILRYHELRKIDLTHEQAITGAARLLSLPDETVKEWLQGAKSALPPVSGT
jgi:membrane associated rhomboid family serine protease